VLSPPEDAFRPRLALDTAPTTLLLSLRTAFRSPQRINRRLGPSGDIATRRCIPVLVARDTALDHAAALASTPRVRHLDGSIVADAPGAIATRRWTPAWLATHGLADCHSDRYNMIRDTVMGKWGD
jgi:hypothetical protein